MKNSKGVINTKKNITKRNWFAMWRVENKDKIKDYSRKHWKKHGHTKLEKYRKYNAYYYKQNSSLTFYICYFKAGRFVYVYVGKCKVFIMRQAQHRQFFNNVIKGNKTYNNHYFWNVRDAIMKYKITAQDLKFEVLEEISKDINKVNVDELKSKWIGKYNTKKNVYILNLWYKT